MVAISAGEFLMGSPATEAQRESGEAQITIRIANSFAVGRYAVARGEFAAFVTESGYAPGGGCHIYTGSTWRQQSTADWRSPGFSQTDRHPVVCMNWNDAKVYVAWLSKKAGLAYRLPSDSEREYVTRAGTSSTFWSGPKIDASQANYDGATNSEFGSASSWRKITVPVDTFVANAWGLHNVHGNVWEWTEDCWNASNTGNPATGAARGSGDCTHRVLRGGSWSVAARFLRAAVRVKGYPVFRSSAQGIRVARTLN
jgi:formylglycine-generating enzyme required for sulfatase activity